MFKLRFEYCRVPFGTLQYPPAEPTQEGDIQQMYTTCLSEKTEIKHWPAMGQCSSQFAPRFLLLKFGYKI